MFDRQISVIYGKYSTIYESVVSEATGAFEKKIGTLSVFHKILVDRVADSYVKAVKAGDGPVADAKEDEKSDALKKWLGSALAELHSATIEAQSRKEFYEKVVGILEESLPQASVRKDIYKKLEKLVEE